MVIQSSGIWCIHCYKFIAYDTEQHRLTGEHGLQHYCKCGNQLTNKNDI